jgi:hypothetical protein
MSLSAELPMNERRTTRSQAPRKKHWKAGQGLGRPVSLVFSGRIAFVAPEGPNPGVYLPDLPAALALDLLGQIREVEAGAADTGNRRGPGLNTDGWEANRLR